MGLSHKNFYGGRARIYKQYVARGNANGIANFVNFQKNVKFSVWWKGSEIFFCAKHTIFFIEKRIA